MTNDARSFTDRVLLAAELDACPEAPPIEPVDLAALLPLCY